MTTYLFANNANTTLAAPIGATDTSLTLSSGAGSKFPSPTSGQQFSITMKDAATGQQTEIMYCTDRVGDVCTVIRGEESTTAQPWTTGDIVANVLTAGIASLFSQTGGFTNPMTAKGDLIAGGTSGTPTRLPVGSDGNVLAANSGAADGVSWESPPWLISPLTTKGDLLTDNGSGPVRLPVGSDGQALVADSTQADGIKWGSVLTNPMTAKGDLIAGAGGGAPSRVAVGADGTVLTADSSQTDGVRWGTSLTNPMTTAGDIIIGGTAGAATRLAAGSAGNVLTISSGAPAWEAPSGGGSAPPVNAQTGTSYALALTDAPAASNYSGIITMNNAAANALDVPTHASVAVVAGSTFQIIQLGAGQTTITPAGGVTVNTPSSLTARVQYSTLLLTNLGVDLWVLSGDMT